jgi:hypothetical protein
MNDDLHKCTCAYHSTGIAIPGFKNDRMYPTPKHGSDMLQTMSHKNPTTTSCCFWILILTVKTYTKRIQRLHSSSDMFSTDVQVIRMFALSFHTRLFQRWNKAYVTRHVLGNKHVTTSFRCLTTYKFRNRKNTTLPTVFLHKNAFHCITSLTAHGDT